MDRWGSKRVEIAGANDKHVITTVLCGLFVGDFLPLKLIYKGKTRCCHPCYQFPSDWDNTHLLQPWKNKETMIQMSFLMSDVLERTPAWHASININGQFQGENHNNNKLSFGWKQHSCVPFTSKLIPPHPQHTTTVMARTPTWKLPLSPVECFSSLPVLIIICSSSLCHYTLMSLFVLISCLGDITAGTPT